MQKPAGRGFHAVIEARTAPDILNGELDECIVQLLPNFLQ